MKANADTLAEKIQSLSAEQIAEVEDFVEFLRIRGQERQFTRDASAGSEAAFASVWHNQEDSAYDAL